MNSPIFFMRDEEIVDVFYGDFIEGAVPMVGAVSIGPASGSGNRIIVEGPDGCWEVRANFQVGNYLSIRSSLAPPSDGSGDLSFQRCQRLNPEVVSVMQDHEPAVR